MESNQVEGSSSVNMSTTTQGSLGQSKSVNRSPNFSTEESSSLLKIWSTPEYQEKFTNSAKRHSPIWSDIASELYNSGIPESGNPKYPRRDGAEVKNRVNNLKKDYTKIVNKSGAEGRPEGDEFFDIFDSVLGKRLIVQNPFVSDSIQEINDENVEERSAASESDRRLSTKSRNTDTRQMRKRGKDQLDKSFQEELLSLQRQSLSLAENRKTGEENLFVAMTRFFDSGASYFNSRIKKRKNKSKRRRESNSSAESATGNGSSD